MLNINREPQTVKGRGIQFEARFSQKAASGSDSFKLSDVPKSAAAVPIASGYSSYQVRWSNWFRKWFPPKPVEPDYQKTLESSFEVLKNQYIGARLKQSKAGRWLGYKADPKEEAKALADRLWQVAIEPLTANPEKGAEILAKWKADIEGKYEPGMVRDFGLRALDAVAKKLNNPEAIRKSLNLFTLAMTHGGFEKIEHLLAISRSSAYQQADRTHQQQMLLEGMGPLFVKAFQTASTAPGLFEPHIQESMEKLYQDLTPIPLDYIKAIIKDELGYTLEEAFDKFDEEPLKVASIAQVHRAVLHGNAVVVKIVKPGVKEALEKDLDMLMPIVELADEMTPHFDITELFEDFGKKVLSETNMSRQLPGEPEGEADRLKGMKLALKDLSNVVVPKVYDTHTRKNILTMEFIPGEGLLNFKNEPAVAKGYLTLILDQIFTYGYCQADPHPGNILYNKFNNKYGCIDAGLAYQVPVQERVDFAKTLIALLSRNPELIADSILAQDMEKQPQYAEFKEKIAALCPNQDKLDYKLTLKFLGDTAKLASQLGLETRQFNPMLWKTLFTALAVAKTIDPSVNLSLPAVSRLAYLFLQNRDAGFLMKAGTKVVGEQVSKGYEQASKQVASGYDSVSKTVKEGVKTVGEQVTTGWNRLRTWWTGKKDKPADKPPESPPQPPETPIDSKPPAPPPSTGDQSDKPPSES